MVGMKNEASGKAPPMSPLKRARKTGPSSADNTPLPSPPPSSLRSMESPSSADGEMDTSRLSATSGTGAVISVNAEVAPRFINLASDDWGTELETISAAMGWSAVQYDGSFLPPPSSDAGCHYHVYQAKDRAGTLPENAVASRALGRPVRGDAVIVRSGPGGAYDPVITAEQLKEALVFHGAQQLKHRSSFQSLIKRNAFIRQYPVAQKAT